MVDISLRIQFEMDTSLPQDNMTPEEYVTYISGKIEIYNEMKDDFVLAGKIQLYFCDMLSAYDNHCSLFDVMDSHSSTLEEFFTILYNPSTEELRTSISKLLNLDESDCDKNILIFDRIELLPEYRGLGITKRVINHSIKLFSNQCNLIVLQCFPLQLSTKEQEKEIQNIEWHKSLQLDILEKDKKKATKSLSNYYKSLGFISIPRTNFMLIKNPFNNW